MGKNQFFGSTDRDLVGLGKIIASPTLGNHSDEYLQEIFENKKGGNISKVVGKIEKSSQKRQVNIRAISIEQLMVKRERFHIEDIFKRAMQLKLEYCLMEALLLTSNIVKCRGDNETMLCAMSPVSESWGTCGILKFCGYDDEYKLIPEFFHPFFEFDPEIIFIFME